MYYDELLDTSGLLCPHVLVKAKQALKRMKAEAILQVITTDPSSVLDFKVWAATQGVELLKVQKNKKQFIFWIKK